MVHASSAPLTDNHNRVHDYLRVSLTDRCDFRCLYCMPEEGVEWQPHDTILTFEEIERLVGVFARLGVTKVRLTGGEPTVRKGYLDLVGRISAIPGLEKRTMTTNGARLASDALALKQSGLTGINVSIDSLNAEKFARITRRDKLGQVLEGLDAAIAVGLNPKVNVVVLAGVNEDEVADFADFAQQRDIEVRFIEFMPFLGNQWQPGRVVAAREIRQAISQRHTLTPIPGHPSDVAQEYSLAGAGKIGIVASVTESFCGGCSRLRLTSDGRLKTCLFLPPQHSLRDMLRQGAADEEVAQTIRDGLLTKWAGHPPMAHWQQRDHLPMVQIGG